jgi:plastocyanin
MPAGHEAGVAGHGSFRRLRAAAVTLGTVLLTVAVPAVQAAELTVAVQDHSAHGIPGVVVLAEPDHPTREHRAVRTVVMDQIHMQFVPNILVIQTGSAVDFPNSDRIRHQVYSFSAAKSFELSLYAGHKYPPVLFDRAGLVTVGCNIHDNMIGYIYVTDSPFFGRTDAHGRLLLQDLPAGDYTLTIWHPGMHEPDGQALRRHVSLGSDERAAQFFTLTRALRADMNAIGDMGSMHWAQN